jgi:hypothetical protein
MVKRYWYCMLTGQMKFDLPRQRVKRRRENRIKFWGFKKHYTQYEARRLPKGAVKLKYKLERKRIAKLSTPGFC